MNRARLFLHSLQVDPGDSWDDTLSTSRKHEWSKICKQANKAPPPQISRMVGLRNDIYELVAFVDASKQIYASVVIILYVVLF